MPTRKAESFSIGGVSSRDNPANFPINRSIRCTNFCPQASGQLRLRSGYSVAMPATNDTGGATTIHSLLYYEQFAASYLGPQFALYGKGVGLYDFNLAGGPSLFIATLSNANPWGHFRARNSIFLANGTDFKQWDGSKLRPVGIRAPLANGVENSTITTTSAYAANATTSHVDAAWVDPNNITGPPDGLFAYTIITPPVQYSDWLNAGYSSMGVPSGDVIAGFKVKVWLHVNSIGSSFTLYVQPRWNGANIGQYKQIDFTSDDINLGPGYIELGDASDLWGDSGWVPGRFNDGTLQIGLEAFSNTGGQLSADAVQVTVTSKTNPAGPTVSFTADANGSWAPAQLSGYQAYMAYYNPQTQHMGNRIPIGDRVGTNATAVAMLIVQLPDLSAINAEWVKVIGVTNDGGEVPHELVDRSGNMVVVPNAATTASFLLGNVDVLSELPTRNDVPPPLGKFARVGTRIFGALSGSPTMYYSNDIADISNANYVGRPEESWPGNQTENLPSGEEPTSIHAYRLEGWFFSRTVLFIWSQFLQQQGANPWRGPYPGGCPSQRGFVETPYGPFWVTAELELATFMDDGVISVSDEYEAALLAKISTKTSDTIEVAYLRDPSQLTDEIVVRGLDKDGNVVIVVHDFRLKDERSPHGQGYNYQYGGVTVRTFAGAGYTPRFNVYDTNGRMRLWAGSTQGFIAQLEDGSSSDNGTVYSGDYIGLISVGPNRPGLVELEWQGDGNVQFSWTKDYNNTLAQFTPAVTEQIPGESSRWASKMGGEGRWLYARLQLKSHPADGSFAITDPPFSPLPVYGVVNMVDLKLGAERPEGR